LHLTNESLNLVYLISYRNGEPTHYEQNVRNN
jgi:hypothetical protein